jgi:toxin FitB
VKYLIDTNVLSEVRKGSRCHPNVRAWWTSTAQDEKFLSVLTIGEVRKGIEKLRRRDVRSAAVLEKWLNGIVEEQADRILVVNLDIAEEWARLNAGDPLPIVDSLIAATASVHGMTLVTRDTSDVARTGVDALNPWQT